MLYLVCKQRLWLLALMLALGLPAHAKFSTFYIFGDSVSATGTNNATGSATNYYYGKRYSNGRVWVEVLAERQGLGAHSVTNSNWHLSSNNVSFYGHYSPILVTNVNRFTNAPLSIATNALFIVWVNNADFVGDMTDASVGAPNGPNNGTNLALWTTAINQHLTNHFRALTNLYAKGMRTLLAPPAADVTAVPQFNNAGTTNYRAFVRQRIISFNTNYAALLQQVANISPGLVIYSPDIFSLVDRVLTNAAVYGVTNARIDALSAGLTLLNGAGTNYIFWDYLGDPTAKLHAVIADFVQQTISPGGFDGLDDVGGANQLRLSNAPVGLSTRLLFKTNLLAATWTTNLSFISTNENHVLTVPRTNAAGFYSLQFPWQWSWP